VTSKIVLILLKLRWHYFSATQRLRYPKKYL
jgi:hypothetical protein